MGNYLNKTKLKTITKLRKQGYTFGKIGKIFGLSRQRIHQLENKGKERKKVLNYYTNGTFQCKKCGCNVYELLQIDHINNDGAEHRKKVKNIYKWLIKNEYPNGFQVLCANCNWLKMAYPKVYEKTTMICRVYSRS